MEKTDAIKLLAIEDKPDILTTLSAVVRNALPRTRVLTATNGPAGIELAAAEDPDVILLNILMPGMDSFEVCRRLKADVQIRDIPVVFLTALITDPASRAKALEAGAEDFLAKPFETVELIAQIKAMAKIKAANRSRRTEKERLEALVAERTRMVRESEERFRMAQAIGHVGSWEYNLQTTEFWGSDEAKRIYGFDPEQANFSNQEVEECIPESKRVHQALVDLIEADKSYNLEFEIHPRDGSEPRIIVSVAKLQRDKHGDPLMVTGVIQDITDRKRTEELLRANASFLKTVFSAISDPAAVINTDDYSIALANEAYGGDTVVGKSCFAVSHRISQPCLGSDHTCPLLQVISSGRPFTTEHIHFTESGETRSIEITAHPIFDNNGKVGQVVEYCKDITERKKAEEALRESEATVRKKLKSIVEPKGDISTLELSDIMDIEVMQFLMEEFYRNTGMLGAVLDLSGKVIVAFGWQDICIKFHRCHPDTLRNCMESDTVLTQGVPPGTVRAYQCKNNMWDMVTPLMVGDRHIGNVFFGQFFHEGETPDLELFRAQARQHGFDETEYLAALARVPHFSREAAETGLLFCAQVAGIVATLSYNAIKQARMLAERERLRKELITLNTELELKVEQRTAQLEASNQELEAFSYSVSHDLRAPLRHISGYVDLLNNRFREDLPEKAGHYLHEITDSARQMGELIDDLLQFSRTGRQELRHADMEMSAAVQEALEKLKPDTKNRNISWTIAELPRVFGDSSLLQQVWINLLENAVKYTQYKDEAKIEVGCTREADHWEFIVRDNGVGFDMQYAHKLFGVFQRLHSPAEFEGTGIGLANVQRIVHKHGGRVRAEGRPDEGAAFYFTIPRNTSNGRGKS